MSPANGIIWVELEGCSMNFWPYVRLEMGGFLKPVYDIEYDFGYGGEE